jgi:hypothetical protein
MKFYLLDDPAKPGEFARFMHVGTWSKGAICEVCGVTTEKLLEPLQIEWDKGTDRIGSFSWCGYHCVVTSDVRAFCELANVECSFGQVEVMQPKEKTKRKRVFYPYNGPQLHWLIPLKRLPLNEVVSGVQMTSECSKCGFRQCNFKRDGLVIDRRSWGGISMFMIEQFNRSRATFVTETLLDELKSQSFTNFYPRFAGTIE